MKKIISYLFFFISLFNGMAQQRASKFSLLIPPIAVSVELATRQLDERTSLSEKDTAQALVLLRSAAGIFHRNNAAKAEGQCRMAIADIYFKAEQYNRAFGNYVTALDLFYEVSQPDLMQAQLGVAKSQYHRGLYR